MVIFEKGAWSGDGIAFQLRFSPSPVIMLHVNHVMASRIIQLFMAAAFSASFIFSTKLLSLSSLG